jgi:hypothetical protein
MRVNHRRFDVLMAQQFLNRPLGTEPRSDVSTERGRDEWPDSALKGGLWTC